MHNNIVEQSLQEMLSKTRQSHITQQKDKGTQHNSHVQLTKASQPQASQSDKQVTSNLPGNFKLMLDYISFVSHKHVIIGQHALYILTYCHYYAM